MRQFRVALFGVMVLLATSAQASLISVDMTFDTDFPTWSGSFAYDDTTGQAWDPVPTLTSYALSALNITDGTSTWTLADWNASYTPPIGGAVVDILGYAALFGTALDAATSTILGTSISVSEGEIFSSEVGTDGPVHYTTTTSVPAPATLALFGLGLAGLGWSRRKKA